MLTIALICALSFASHVIADCSIPPIYLDISAREVEGSNTALSYGVPISIGTAIQQLSLWPSLVLNETTLADNDYCSNTTASCTASSVNGFFDPRKSTSFTSTSSQSLDNTSSTSGTDILHLTSSLNPSNPPPATNLSGFPLQLLSNSTSTPTNLLGLGLSSSLLTTLHAAGSIASRSYGLFLGTGSPQTNITGPAVNTVNGSLTLGGYDAARFQVPVESFPIANANAGGLILPISVITRENSSTNLLSAPLSVRLSTTQYELTLPSSLASTLSNTTSSQSITLTLGANLTLTLPLSSITFSPSGPFLLGTSALSHLYLTVSQDSTPPTFFLALAIPSPGYAVPVSLCTGQTPTPLRMVKPSSFVRNGLVGLIVGVGIGGSAILVLVFLVGRALWRGRDARGIQRRKEKEMEMEMGYMSRNEKQRTGKTRKGKTNQVRVIEKEDWREEEEGEQEQPVETMYFAPPPRRATVLVEKSGREKKMALKGILKVKSSEK